MQYIEELEPLRKSIHNALRSWHQVDSNIDDDQGLAQLLLVRNRLTTIRKFHPNLRKQVINAVVLEAIELLSQQASKSAEVIKLRFIDEKQLSKIAIQLNVSESTVNRWQAHALEQLAVIIDGLEQQAHEARMQYVEATFPPSTYSTLFGHNEPANRLKETLLRDANPYIVSIVGIGGIGKTSLADFVVRDVLKTYYFERIFWYRIDPYVAGEDSHNPHTAFIALTQYLSEKLGMVEGDKSSHEQQLSYVRRSLKEDRCLVVIDNLEAVLDSTYLLVAINNIANPTKFLLTSRTRILKNIDVYNFSLSELNLTDAANLIRHQAGILGVDSAEIMNEDIQKIYKSVGGNPLALKMVVSLLDYLSLDEVLQSLQLVSPEKMENLYLHIYWQIWRILTPEARIVLQSMPLLAEKEGTTIWIKELSGLADEQFWFALQELRNHSLIEVRGSIREKRYGISRLTRSFLLTEIVNWPVAEE